MPRKMICARENNNPVPRYNNARDFQLCRLMGHRIANAYTKGVSGAYVRIWLSSSHRVVVNFIGISVDA